MRLWHLLIAICFAASLGAALAPPRVLGAGLSGYILATASGFAVGASCSWLMWRMHKATISMLQLRADEQDPMLEGWGFVFYLSKVVWIILSSTLGFWLSSVLLRLVL